MPRLTPPQVAAALKPSRTPAQLANDARLRSRRSTPAIHVKQNLTGDQDVRSVPQHNISISTTGDAEATRSPIEVIDPLKFESKAADEKFMNEMVEIQVEADDDPNAPLFIPCGHQGVTQYIRRGQPQTVKRKFLYSLIAAKSARLACAFGKDQNGQEFNRLQGASRTTHRVTIIRDTDKGRQAYLKWMHEA